MPIRGRTRIFETSPQELSTKQLDQEYGNLLSAVLGAFSHDPSYLIDIAEHGSLIKHKKRLWAVRMEVLKAEKEARQLCSTDPEFLCTNESACGFGNCRWASPVFAGIKLAPPLEEGKQVKHRPVPAKSPTYRIEDAIAAVIKRRHIVAPARLSSGRRAQ